MGRIAHEDAIELLGAHAVHALDPDEQTLLNEHITSCPPCQLEVSEHSDTLRQLTGELKVPESVWNGIQDKLYQQPPALRIPRRRRRATTMVAMAAALTALVVSAGLINRVVQQDKRLDGLQAELGEEGLRRLALAAENQHGAQTISLTSNDGAITIRATVLADGSGFISADELPALTPDRTYQLWAIVEDQRISAGLLGSRPTVTSFRVPAGASALAVTAERGSGVVASENDAVASGLFIAT